MTVAIIGTGWGARVQVPGFRGAGLQVTAIAGSDLAKTQKTATDLNIPVAVNDWRQLLARPEIKIISIVTPPHLHAEMAITALNAGKHVLCEKPTALNITEAAQMTAAAAQFPNQFAQIDHELRFFPPVLLARQMIADGKIGTIRFAVAHIFDSRRASLTIPWNWWSDVTKGGGMLGAVGSHYIDLLRYLLKAEVLTVSAALNAFTAERPGDAGMQKVTSDDYFNLRLRYSNGTVATIEGNGTVQTPEPPTLTLYGTEGTLRICDEQLLYAKLGDDKFTDISPSFAFAMPANISGAFARATLYLCSALHSFMDGDQSAVKAGATFADGLRIQAVMDAARLSDRQRSIVVAAGLE